MSKSLREFRVVKQTMANKAVQYSVQALSGSGIWVECTTRFTLDSAVSTVEQCRRSVVVKEEVLDV